MGRFMRKLRERAREELDAALERAGSDVLGGSGRRGMIADQAGAQAKFEAEKPDAMKKNVRMISGCEDTQTSADVSNVQSFSLPDPAGTYTILWCCCSVRVSLPFPPPPDFWIFPLLICFDCSSILSFFNWKQRPGGRCMYVDAAQYFVWYGGRGRSRDEEFYGGVGTYA